MKKLTLLTAAALACCGMSPIFAQVQILRSGTPTVAPRLVSDQTELGGLDPFAEAKSGSGPAVAKETIANPFDYFAEDLPSIEPQAVRTYNSQELPSEAQSLLDENASPNSLSSQPEAAAEDPASLPVGLHHRRNSSVVDTIITEAALGNIPHCAMTGVDWGGSLHTPNPVADWLMREECVNGLWANYPQQRAAECAAMWAHLAGHSCGGCGSCGTVAGPCSACAAPPVRRNRYLEGRLAAPLACGTNSGACHTCQTGAACAACDDAQPAAPCGSSDCAQATPHKAPAELVNTKELNVAKLPSLPTFR